MRIAVIGAGQVGGAIGSGWSKAGHAVSFGVRDPASPKLDPLRALAGVTFEPAAQAAAGAEVVALALPWTGAEAAVKALGDLSGKIVLDAMNPLVFANGALQLDRGFQTSGGEAVAAWLPGARVVKTLNQVGFEVMANAQGFPVRPVMFVAGEDEPAKRIAIGLVEDLGFEALDAGGLNMARLLEPLAMVWINQALFRGLGRDWAFGVSRRGA